MDITGHFESASCVIEVDGSATLAQVKGKLVAELGVPGARRVGVRMKGGGDIGNDDLRICDTEMDEGCAVELYRTGANMTPGVIPCSEETFTLTLSPCDRYLAVMHTENGVCIFDTETHECLCRFPCEYTTDPAFSPCSEWISCVNKDTQCAEVHDVKTGALQHSFGDEGDETMGTAWSPCGTKLLSCCKSKGLQVWDIATGVVAHEWDHIVRCEYVMVVAGDRVAMFGDKRKDVTVWDYTTGVKVFVFTCAFSIRNVALSPNRCFIAVCCYDWVRVWNIETGQRISHHFSENTFTDVALSNDIVAAFSAEYLFPRVCFWSISSGTELLWHRFEMRGEFGRLRRGIALSSCGGVAMHHRDEGVDIADISHLS